MAQWPGIFKRLFRDGGKAYILKESVIPILEGGGLAYENEGDGIYVDFDTMDPKRFEDMLKALTIPIFLTANKPFYVNGQTGNDDTSIEGIGESADVPFKTIQACATYVATFFNMNTRHATIYISSGTYNETLSLGGFSSTTGYVEFRCLDGDYTVTIADETSSNLVSVSEGAWRFYNMNFSYRALPSGTGSDSHHACLYSSGGRLDIYDCDIEATDAGTTTVGSDDVRLVWSWGGSIYLQHSSGSTRRLAMVNNGRFTGWNGITAANRGLVRMSGDNTSQANATWSISGVYDNVGYAYDNSTIIFDLSAAYDPVITAASGATFSGRKYRCTSGGSIVNGESCLAGTEAGTVQSSTYSWCS